jgi:hypothetical protein
MTSISVKKQCFFSVIRNKETRISFFFSDDEDKDILFDHPFQQNQTGFVDIPTGGPEIGVLFINL